MNNTSLMTTAKVVLPMTCNGALKEANCDLMPKAAGAKQNSHIPCRTFTKAPDDHYKLCKEYG